MDMRRRQFITLLGGAAAWPLGARAQQTGRVWRIGVLVAEPWPEVEGLHDGLRELGYHEGENLLLEYRFANSDAGRFPELAAELIKIPVDVIVTWGTPATLAALKATRSIPIIMSAGDPVGAGLVASLDRPEGNVTGISSQTAGGEEKRLELLKELLPNLSRVAVLSNSVLVMADPFLAHERARLATLLVEHRLPSIYPYHEGAVAGGLMAYMTSYYE